MLLIILQAHALYNSIAVRDSENDTWKTRVFEAQKQYWKKDVNPSHGTNQRVTSELRDHLAQTRQTSINSLDQMADIVTQFCIESCNKNAKENFSLHIKQLAKQCTDGMLELSSMVITKAVAALGSSVPCAFSAVAIGSMAKGEATPYSDLEFMFILEHKNDAIIEYFEKLAMTAYFFIGNLGETRLSYMAIDELEGWFDDVCISGFKIDGLSNGAGNIPTGNGTTNPRNHLILTVDELIDKFKETLDNPVDEDARRGDFSAMLTYTKEFYRHGQEADTLLSGFKLFWKNVQPNQARQKANEDMFWADIFKYRFELNQAVADNGYVVNSKKDLYRFPSILLFNISILVGVVNDNSWDTLDDLNSQRLISESLFTSLRFLLACTCYFRLSAYLYHNSHNDRMSLLQETSTVTQIRRRPGLSSPFSRWFIPLGIFFVHFQDMLPVKRLFLSSERQNILLSLKSGIKGKTWHCRYLTLYFCHRTQGAWKALLEMFTEQTLLHHPEVVIAELKALDLSTTEIWQSVRSVTYILYKKREYEASQNYLLQMKVMIESTAAQSLLDKLLVAEVLDEEANCNIFMHRHKDAERSYSESLQSRSGILKSNDMLLGTSHYYLGRCLRIQNDLQQAKSHHLKALSIFHYHASRETLYDYRGDEISKTQSIDMDFSSLQAEKVLEFLNHPSPQIGHTLWNLASIYGRLRYFSIMHKYNVKALDTYLRTYGNSANHQHIADVLFEMGNSSCALGNYVHADFYYCKSLEMIANMFSGKHESPYQSTLGSDPDKHLVCDVRCQLSVNTFLSVPGYKVAHPQSANILRRYGQHLMSLGKLTLATTVLEKALTMYKQCFGEEKPCFDIFSTKALIGEKLWRQGEKEMGILMCKQAAEDLTALGDVVALMETADIHHKLGHMYLKEGDIGEAKTNFGKALHTYESECEDTNHPKVVNIRVTLQTIE